MYWMLCVLRARCSLCQVRACVRARANERIMVRFMLSDLIRTGEDECVHVDNVMLESTPSDAHSFNAIVVVDAAYATLHRPIDSMKINQMNVETLWHSHVRLWRNRIGLAKKHEANRTSAGEGVERTHCSQRSRMFLSFRYDLVWSRSSFSCSFFCSRYHRLRKVFDKVGSHMQHTHTNDCPK